MRVLSRAVGWLPLRLAHARNLFKGELNSPTIALGTPLTRNPGLKAPSLRDYLLSSFANIIANYDQNNTGTPSRPVAVSPFHAAFRPGRSKKII
jgi:hypothetical protein